MKPEQYLEELVLRYPALNSVMDRLTEAYVVMEKCFRQGGKAVSCRQRRQRKRFPAYCGGADERF